MSEETIFFSTPALVTLLLLYYVNQRLASPILAIPIRWLRWVLFSLFAAQANEQLNLIDRPVGVVAGVFFITWFLCEAGFNWLKISAISLSPLPLFPRAVVNTGGDEWPTQKRLLRVREWLRNNQFTPQQALKAEIGGGVWLRTSVYHNKDNTIRLHVLFVPQENNVITVCFSLATLTTGTRRYVTDNLYIPFGGFYPESWRVARNPWRRSLARLITQHTQRVKQSGEKAIAWEISPSEDSQQQQQHMEVINLELGYLMPHADREEYGKISAEGRFRIWKEAWLLDYFGRAAQYH